MTQYKFRRRGVTALSYGLLVGLIGVVALVAVTSTGSNVDTLFQDVSGSLSTVAGAAEAAPTAQPAPTAPLDCPQIGDVCGYGTIYLGFSLDQGLPLYATRCDFGMSHDGSNCSGTRSTQRFAQAVQAVNLIDSELDDGDLTGPLSTVDGTPDGWESYDSGQNNTTLLAGLDASSDSGFQSFEAAVACDGLSIHGHSDWYLPAQGELTRMYDEIIASGPHRSSFATSYGGGDWHLLFSSTETSASSAAGWDVAGGNVTSMGKSSPTAIRCVRQG